MQITGLQKPFFWMQFYQAKNGLWSQENQQYTKQCTEVCKEIPPPDLVKIARDIIINLTFDNNVQNYLCSYSINSQVHDGKPSELKTLVSGWTFLPIQQDRKSILYLYRKK